MPGHVINLVGKKFGKLTALEYAGKQRWKLYNRIKNLGWSVKKAITIPCILFLLSGCAKTGNAPIEYPSCPPMLREATYRAMQADERRDYRIAIESCRAK